MNLQQKVLLVNFTVHVEMMPPVFKKISSQKKKKFPHFPENFFSRGTFPEKCPPGIFRGPPGKFPEIPEIPGNSRKN